MRGSKAKKLRQYQAICEHVTGNIMSKMVNIIPRRPEDFESEEAKETQVHQARSARCVKCDAHILVKP